MPLRILHITPAYYPATYWGGPIYSLLRLSEGLAKLDSVVLRVLTTDSAGPSVGDRVTVSRIPMRTWTGYEVYYCRRVCGVAISPGLLVKMWPLIRWSDVVHLTGTYSFPTIPTLLACRLLRKPVVWSPRGALKATQEWPGARKRLLKKLWEWICRLVIPRESILHVTSEEEKASSLARLPNMRAAVIPNGVDVPSTLLPRVWLPGGSLRIMYIGRLAKEKGIENLLEALGKYDDRHATLDIYGSGDPLYVAKLRNDVRGLGIESNVTFRGFVDGEEKEVAFSKADVCVVPSHSESFGIVIAEALAHGVPVIASKGTPWQGLDTSGCGFWVENDPDSLAMTLTRVRRLSLQELGERGRTWMRQSYSWDRVAREMNAIYRDLTNSITSMNK